MTSAKVIDLAAAKAALEPEAKEKRMARGRRGEQMKIDGTEPLDIPELTSLAKDYVELRDKRQTLTIKEGEKLAELKAAAKRFEEKKMLSIDHGKLSTGELIPIYSYIDDENKKRTIWHGMKDTLKVRVANSDPNEDVVD